MHPNPCAKPSYLVYFPYSHLQLLHTDVQDSGTSTSSLVAAANLFLLFLWLCSFQHFWSMWSFGPGVGLQYRFSWASNCHLKPKRGTNACPLQFWRCLHNFSAVIFAVCELKFSQRSIVERPCALGRTASKALPVTIFKCHSTRRGVVLDYRNRPSSSD